MIRATTNKIWTNPPIVYEVTNPSAHRIKRITKIVQIMFQLLSRAETTAPDFPIRPMSLDFLCCEAIELFLDLLPVHHMPPMGNIFGSLVMVLEIIRVFPNIEA